MANDTAATTMMGAKPKKSEHHAADHRPANTRNHAHLVCDGRGLRDALGGDHEREGRLHAGMVDCLGREGDHEHEHGDSHEVLGPRTGKVAKHDKRENGVERGHDPALASTVGNDAAHRRQGDIGNEAGCDHSPVQRARSSQVEQMERKHEL